MRNEDSVQVEAYVEAVLQRIPRAHPERGRIEADVRAHLMERVTAGDGVASAIRQMGPAEELVRAYLTGSHLIYASVGRRVGAFTIDLLLGAVWIVPLLGVLNFLDPLATAGTLFGLVWGGIVVLGISAALLSVLYFPVLEALFGQTLGKRLMGICVTTESGERIGWGAAILRRLPFFFEFFLLDALFALFTRRRQRAFDMVAKTLVVRYA